MRHPAYGTGRAVLEENHYVFTHLVCPGVDFLVRYEGRNENEIARTRFIAEFQTFAPTHPGTPPHNVEDGFELTVMVRTGLCSRFHLDCTGPKLSCASPR